MYAKWLALIALCANAPSVMAEGEYEIDQACVAVGCFPGDTPGFPVTLANSGAYRLTSNLLVTGGVSTHGIDITAAQVDLDLGGFELFGGGSCQGYGATLTCSGAVSGRGIILSATSLVHIHDGTIRGMGEPSLSLLSLASGSTLERLRLTENGEGAWIDGVLANVSVQATQIHHTRNFGPFGSVNYLVALHISDSEFSHNRFAGAALANGSTVTDSTFVGNGGLGMHCSLAAHRCALGRNSFFGNNGGTTTAQFGTFVLRDMGHNVCDDGTCP